MATRTSHNKNSSAVKRILSEARELANDDSTEYTAAPLEDDIFEWHATIRGPSDTEFEGGLYHARINLPPEYPFKAPSVMVTTPNGRFELNKKLCISFTSYHEELWQPAWGVRTAIVGLQGFFPAKGDAAMGVGILEYPTAERKRLAKLSRDWVCPQCQQSNLELLPDPPSKSVPIIEAPAEPLFPPPLEVNTDLSRDAAVFPDAEDPPNSSIPSIVIHEASPEGLHPALPYLNDATPTQPSEQSVPPIVRSASPSPAIPPAPSAQEGTDSQPQPLPLALNQQPHLDGLGLTATKAPWWLDAMIVGFSVLIAMIAGKRLVHLWDYMLKDDLLTL